jgi:cytochrome c553
MESSGAVLAVPTVVERSASGGGSGGFGRGDVDMAMPGPGGGFTMSQGFELRPIETVLTGHGPRGVAFVDGARPVVDTWLAHAVQPVSYAPLVDALRDSVLNNGMGEMGFTPMVAWRSAERAIPIAQPTLDADLELGRLLFFTAVDARMSGHGSGTACATCHFDARNDGLTWGLPDGTLQTPSLAGKVSLTEPVTWLSAVPTVADEAMLTSEGRMGGAGLPRTDAERIARFIDSTPYPVVPVLDTAAVTRGKAVFEGAAQCATCHTGEVLTDNAAHTMFGVAAVRTPTLRGLAATAPYLHDGRAATLEQLVEITEAGGMGVTSHLSAADKADLVAYLRSL